jgi:hypothetical protein
VARGEDPVPARRPPRTAEARAAQDRAGQDRAGQDRRAGPAGPGGPALPDRASLLSKLRGDPALRLSQTGREALRWLDSRTLGPDGWETMLDGLPPHSAYLVADLANWCSQRWLEVAEALREQPGR